MRVLQVITDNDRRGAQVFATQLAPALAARGHDVTTVALAPGGHATRLGHRVLGTRRLGMPTLRALRAEVAHHDVVIAHGSSTLPACAIACAAGPPFVYRQISESLFWAGRLDRRVRVGASLRQAAAVVCLASSQASVLVDAFGVPRRRLYIVPNGIPVAAFTPAGPHERGAARAEFGLRADATVVLALGALVPEKGVERLVPALEGLEGVELLVVGSGPGRNALERLARSGPVPISLHDGVADPRRAYAAADVFALPSLGGDSMPATLLEAGAMGLACVATDVGAVAETIEDGVTGVVVGRDDDRALAAALSSLVASPARRRELGEAARVRVRERFDLDVVAAGWSQVLEAVAGCGRR